MERFEVLKALNMSNNLSQMSTDANTKSERYIGTGITGITTYSLGNINKIFSFAELQNYLRIWDRNSHTVKL
jgi:hypothetical protein